MTPGMYLNIHLERLKPELGAYLKSNYQEQVHPSPNMLTGNIDAGRTPFLEKADLTPRQERDLCELLNELGESFHERLFTLIAGSGLTDAEVYRRADLDRKLFSKIRSNPAYHPGKGTVLALCIALELSIEDTADLLSRAGYAFSPGDKGDLIVKFFIEHGVYDIDAVKYTLEEYGQTMT